MKITKTYLKRIIQEVLEEAEVEGEGEMDISKLNKLATDTFKLLQSAPKKVPGLERYLAKIQAGSVTIKGHFLAMLARELLGVADLSTLVAPAKAAQAKIEAASAGAAGGAPQRATPGAPGTQ